MEFTPELIQKMVILIAVIPAVVCAIAGACMIFYRLDEKQIAEYNAKKYGSVQEGVVPRASQPYDTISH